MSAQQSVEEVVESIYTAVRQGEIRSVLESLSRELRRPGMNVAHPLARLLNEEFRTEPNAIAR
ncbi:MAG: hypothetical protein AB1758_08900 [Candidatus Eremiobacterota bacterium]